MRITIFFSLRICILIFVLTTQLGAGSENDTRKQSSVGPSVSADPSSPGEASPRVGPSAATDATASSPKTAAPIYVPPRRGQPRARVGGSVRGSTVALPSVLALVPDHVAHTARSQPTLLWHLDRLPSGRATLTFRFNLTSEKDIDPLIAVELEMPTQPGLQRIDLARYGFSLETGQEYRWSVALVTDSENRVRDVVTLGWIERVEEADTSGADEDAAAQADTTSLAAAGLWYDAVDVADQSEREALLEQIGLASSEKP